MKPNRTPLIVAIVLMLLPVLYVGSYLALVRPVNTISVDEFLNLPSDWDGTNYRYGGHRAAVVFWPLEQIDRKVRPGVWKARIRFMGPPPSSPR